MRPVYVLGVGAHAGHETAGWHPIRLQERTGRRRAGHDDVTVSDSSREIVEDRELRFGIGEVGG